MDTRNGDLYPSRQAAIDAGVPEDHVVEVRAPLERALAMREELLRAEAAMAAEDAPRAAREQLLREDWRRRGRPS